MYNEGKTSEIEKMQGVNKYNWFYTKNITFAGTIYGFLLLLLSILQMKKHYSPIFIAQNYINLIFALVFLSSCQRGALHRQLVQADSLMNDHTDSAYTILCRIDSSRISSDADMAYYGLLVTQVKYKKEEKVYTNLLSRREMNSF